MMADVTAGLAGTQAMAVCAMVASWAKPTSQLIDCGETTLVHVALLHVAGPFRLGNGVSRRYLPVRKPPPSGLWG